MTFSEVFACIVCLVCATLTSYAGGDRIQFDQRWASDNVKVEEGGDSFVITVPKITSRFTARVGLKEKFPAGWQKMTAEYRTVGFSPMSSYIIHVTSGEGSVAAWQVVPAASNWAPIETYTHLSTDGRIDVSLHVESSTAGIAEPAEIQVRNMKIELYQTPADKELLTNGDFAIGVVGEIPPLWYWQYNGDNGDYSIVTDNTYSSGTQTVQIKAYEKPRTLSGFDRPLPDSGVMEFTVWAKSEESVSMTLRLLGNKYKWEASKTVKLSPKWTRYTLSKPCATGTNAAVFIPRVDIKGEGMAHIAGCSLIWKANQTTSIRPSIDVGICMNTLSGDALVPDLRPNLESHLQ